MTNNIVLIGVLAFCTLLPFLIAAGTCFVKFSIVFVIVRNALGLQQVPSNITLNGIALILSFFVMFPIVHNIYQYAQTSNIKFDSADSLAEFMDTGLDEYKGYLIKYSDAELVSFFDSAQNNNKNMLTGNENASKSSIIALLPAYALSEIKSAFKIGFYIYLPFIVVDLVISCVLLTLGMMMMSPVTISTPVKLILFVAIDGWSLLSKGLVLQYVDLATQ